LSTPAELIAGRHAVTAALKGRRRVLRVFVAPGLDKQVAAELNALAAARGVNVSVADKHWLDVKAGNVTHQGIIAEAEPVSLLTVDDVLSAVPDGQAPLLVILDQVQDPHNLGAIIRSAAAAGAHGVIIPERRSAGLGPGTLKAAAGTAEWFPVAQVVNLARTIEQLKKQGLWIVGADSDGADVFWRADFRQPTIFVIGGEDRGLGRLVRDKCDYLVRLPMHPAVPSLNASVAAAVLLYEAVRQRYQQS
jgi:23S rRNA (guanosine2251-2'-O)-methyltransferase